MSTIGNKKDEKKEAGNWWAPAVLMFFRLSAWIAVPVLLAAYVGRWLDKKFGLEPWLFLGSVGFAFIISMIGLVKNAVKEYRKLNKE